MHPYHQQNNNNQNNMYEFFLNENGDFNRQSGNLFDDDYVDKYNYSGEPSGGTFDPTSYKNSSMHYPKGNKARKYSIEDLCHLIDPSIEIDPSNVYQFADYMLYSYPQQNDPIYTNKLFDSIDQYLYTNSRCAEYPKLDIPAEEYNQNSYNNRYTLFPVNDLVPLHLENLMDSTPYLPSNNSPALHRVPTHPSIPEARVQLPVQQQLYHYTSGTNMNSYGAVASTSAKAREYPYDYHLGTSGTQSESTNQPKSGNTSVRRPYVRRLHQNTDPTAEEKRKKHNALEKERRKEVSRYYEQISQIIRGSDTKRRSSKAVILARAKIYVKELEAAMNATVKENIRSNDQRLQLAVEIEQLLKSHRTGIQSNQPSNSLNH